LLTARRANRTNAMRRAYPERWSGSTRNWLPIGTVLLNPERAPLARQLSDAHRRYNRNRPLKLWRPGRIRTDNPGLQFALRM